MTAEEYVKHYISGQGGFESVSVDVALQAIEYAKQEAREEMTKDAIKAEIDNSRSDGKCILSGSFYKQNTGDKVKLIIIKEG